MPNPINKPCTVVARAIDSLLTKSTEKGTPYIHALFEVTEGEFKGERVRWSGWLTEKTAERTIESLQHCGWKGNELLDFARGGLPAGFGSQEVELVIELEPYQGDKPEHQGKSFPQVKWVNQRGGGSLRGEPMDSGSVAALSAKFKGLSMALRAKSAQPGTTKQDASFNFGANEKDPVDLPV